MNARFTERVGRRYIFSLSVSRIERCRSEENTDVDREGATCHMVAYSGRSGMPGPDSPVEVVHENGKECDRAAAGIRRSHLDDLQQQRL